ncbi:MAG: hypothetical protein H5T74_07785 [Actinobacteria bacterium]|nr:hypothetical protein [Actinomycetota bacterium]
MRMWCRFTLTGPRGDNPLGFLATLGVMVTLKDEGIESKLSWKGLTPILRVDMPDMAEKSHEGRERELVRIIHSRLKRAKKRGTDVAEDSSLNDLKKKNLTFSNKEFLDFAEMSFDECRFPERRLLDLISSFGIMGPKKEGKMAPTPWALLSGSGHQEFLKTVNDLMLCCEEDDYHRALFGPWEGDREKYSLRLEPAEDRRYALMDGDPSDSKRRVKTLWGANRLAFEALRLFPTYSADSAEKREGSLGAVGWDDELRSVRWPLWRYPIGVEVVKSILCLPAIWKEGDLTERGRLVEMGIFSVIQSRKVAEGKYKNMTFGIPLWFDY